MGRLKSLFSGSKKKKTKDTNKTTAAPSSAATPVQSESTTVKAPPRYASTASSSSSSSSSNDSTTTMTNRYLKGGGYCSHVHRTYDERWSDEHVELVLQSWNMTARQREKLMEFQQRVKHIDHPLLNCPQQLVYFLVDEGGNLDLAEKWFYEVVQTRTEQPYQFDSICESYVLPDDYDYFPLCVMDGTDREGHPIQITRTGAADCWGFFQRHGKENLIRHALFYQELTVRGAWIDDYERRMKKKVTQYCMIFDLSGLSMRHTKGGLIPTLSFVSGLVQETYPGLVKRVLIIRCPSVFKFIWGLVKHFFHPDLRAMFIFASSEEDSLKLLEKYIDPNVLPTCIHPDGKDGRVARGYEHVIMDGGLLPPEGTYSTPEHCKEGMTRAEYQESSYHRQESELGETKQTGNTRREISMRRKREPVVSCQCRTLLGGRFEELGKERNDPEYKIRIEITFSN